MAEEFNSYGPWIGVILIGLWNFVQWFMGRDVKRYDDGLEDIAELKLTCVSRAELKQAVDDLEERQDKMHAENKNYFEQIMEKIDHYEGRRSSTEHEIRNTVHTLNTKFAVLAALAERAGIKLPESMKP